MPRLEWRKVVIVTASAFLIYCATSTGFAPADESLQLGDAPNLRGKDTPAPRSPTIGPVLPKPHPKPPGEPHKRPHEDEASLARGDTPPFRHCVIHAQCKPGFVCVENGGDHIFNCKPLCQSNDECRKWNFPQIACVRQLHADGGVFQHRVCNDAEWSHLQ